MTDQRCLYTTLWAPRERHEDLLVRLLAPVVAEIRDAPALDSLFFVRFSEPRWQLRFRVLGRPEWIEGPVRALLARQAEAFERRGEIDGHEFGRYEREYERYGGEEGMALAEALFRIDSLMCLDLIAADHRGEVRKSRREVALLLADAVLDVAGFDHEARVAFYAYGYDWALTLKTWEAQELAILEERFRQLRPGLEALFAEPGRSDPALRWGGEAPAAIAGRFLAASRPVVERILAAHRAGRIRQSLTSLFWSYTHMMTNRLGVESTPEAILRYFMHRLLEEREHESA